MAKRYILAMLFLLCAVTGAIAQERFSRHIDSHTFVPKGQWVTGVSVSYSQSNNDNYQFFIVESIDGDTYSFSVTPMVFYMFKDDFGAGGRLGYERSRVKLDNANLIIDSETNYQNENFYCISQKYSAMGAFRNYFSIGDSKRFGLFNEVRLEFGVGESKLTNGTGNDFTGTFEKTYDIGVGVMPGLVMFLSNYSALELSVGVLGFNYSHTKQTNDQIHIANRDTKNANFRINLFSISVGVAFYL